MKRKKIIILAHSRSGSNTLTHCLSVHPKINIIIEPFNQKNKYRMDKESIILLDKIRTKEDLDLFLNRLHQKYNGFKMLYKEPIAEFRDYILGKKDYNYIHLHRKNILAAEISNELSIKSKIWYTSKDDEVKNYKTITKNQKYKEINIDFIKKLIDDKVRQIKYFKGLLKINEQRFLEITYEDLFLPQISIHEKIEKIQNIFEFLGFERIRSKNRLNLLRCKLDQRLKMNDYSTHKCIPNINEIEAKLGNNTTGYIFDEKLINIKKKMLRLKQSIP